MIIRYYSKTPGTPLTKQDISRKNFEIFDNVGNRWRIVDVDHGGFQILTVEDTQGGTPGLNVVPVSGNVVEVEMRP